ncbi:hypothetical protein ACJX0J_035117, partial [Zea mays]
FGSELTRDGFGDGFFDEHPSITTITFLISTKNHKIQSKKRKIDSTPVHHVQE